VATTTQSKPDKTDDRVPFTHPALEGLTNLTDAPIAEILTKYRLGAIATKAGMRDILRWQPRLVSFV